MTEMQVTLAMLDLDGTIGDTSFLHKKLFLNAMLHQGYKLTDEDLKPTLGMSLRDGLVYLLREKFETVLSHGELDVFEATIKKSIKVRFIPELRKTPPVDILMPGALETLEYLHRRDDIKVWVISNSTRANVDAVLEHLGIRHLIDGVIVGEEAQPKPKPDMILHAHNKVVETGVYVVRSVFFGDTTADRGAVIAAREHISHLEFYPIVGATHCPPEARGQQAYPDGRKDEFRALADTLKITVGCTAFVDFRHVPMIVFHGSVLPVCTNKITARGGSVDARSKLAS